MNNRSIKIIKRKDAEAAARANAPPRNAHVPRHSEEKTDSERSREMEVNVSTWVTERRANNDAERNAMLQITLGDRAPAHAA